MNQLDKHMTLDKLKDFPKDKKMSIGFKLRTKQELINEVSSESHIGHLIVQIYKEDYNFIRQQEKIWK